MNFIEEINRLKKEKNAVILAHYYQNGEIQDIADYVGDSFYLAQAGRDCDADIIVYCGVQFMAESAKILAPEKKVLFPVYADAPCCMEFQATPERVKALMDQYPDAKVVCYINSSSEVKGLAHACCTSSSAKKIVENIDAKQIIFVPDRNLGSYVAELVPDKEIITFDGCCNIHDKVRVEDITEVFDKYGKMPVLVHPECKKEIRDMADYIGSTSGILSFAKDSNAKEMLIVTERGIGHELAKQNPDKKFHYLNMFCKSMKKTFLETVYEALNDLKYEIDVEKNIRDNALRSLENMLNLSK